jgi:trigger factor
MALKECTKKEQANSYELEVNVDGETFGNAVNRVYKKQVKSINIPGFRKGKAPRHVIEKMYGSEVFYEDAMQDCYPDALYEAAKEAGIKIVSVETLEAIEASKEGFSFKANVLLSLKWKLITTLALKLQRSQQKLQTSSLTKKLRRFVTATQEW